MGSVLRVVCGEADGLSSDGEALGGTLGELDDARDGRSFEPRLGNQTAELRVRSGSRTVVSAVKHFELRLGSWSMTLTAKRFRRSSRDLLQNVG